MKTLKILLLLLLSYPCDNQWFGANHPPVTFLNPTFPSSSNDTIPSFYHMSKSNQEVSQVIYLEKYKYLANDHGRLQDSS